MHSLRKEKVLFNEEKLLTSEQEKEKGISSTTTLGG